MPNLCNCKLKVRGTSATIRRFLQITKSPGLAFDFEKLVPTRDAARRNELWGTPSNALDPFVDYIEPGNAEEMFHNATVTFSTHWTAPGKLLQQVSEMFPDLMFIMYFDQEGEGFSGLGKYQNGRFVEAVFATLSDFSTGFTQLSVESNRLLAEIDGDGCLRSSVNRIDSRGGSG